MNKIAILAGVALLALLGPAHAETASVSCVAGSTSDIIQIDSTAWPPGISFLAKGSGLNGDYTVEVANDPPVRPSLSMNYIIRATEAASVTHWVPHEGLTAQVGDALDNAIVPVQFVRLNCTNVTAGGVTLGVGTRGHGGQ